MDELELVERLARRARCEPPPPLHVGAEVLKAVRLGQPISLLPLALVAAGAAAAALLVLALAAHAWTGAADPQTSLFPSLEVSAL